MADRTLMWCSKHNEPAWLYSDGSHSCWYDCIVEANTEHTLVELPEIELLRRRGDNLFAMVRDMPHPIANLHWLTWRTQIDNALMGWEKARRG